MCIVTCKIWIFYGLQESEVKTLARDNFYQGTFERLVNQVAVHDQATTPPPESPAHPIAALKGAGPGSWQKPCARRSATRLRPLTPTTPG